MHVHISSYALVYLPAFVCIHGMPLLSLNAIDISYFGVTRPFFLKGAAGKLLVRGAKEVHGLVLDFRISK